MFGFIHWTEPGQHSAPSSITSSGFQQTILTTLQSQVEGGGQQGRTISHQSCRHCFYWWQPLRDVLCSFSKQETERHNAGLTTQILISTYQLELSRIFLHHLVPWWSDNITPVGGAGEGGGASLSIPSATVCNYVRLLGLTPGFSSTRKGQLTLRIKVLLFSSTV